MSDWPPSTLPGLHVDLGQWSGRSGTWLVYPAADYRCARCGAVESASGDAVAVFVATVRDAHRARCTARTTERTTL